MGVKVNVLESTMVRAASETPRRPLWLSNIDMVMTSTHTPTVYIFKKPTAEPFDAAVGVLKEALSKALVLFYPLAGRFSREGDTEKGRLQVDCNDEGVLFVVANSISTTVDDLDGLTPNSNFAKVLLPPIDYSGGISSYPLLLVQITELKCGGIALGILLDHRLADGFSAVHFKSSWAEIARGIDIALPPVIDRSSLRAREPPTTVPNHEHHVIYQPHTKSSKKPRADTVVSVFQFTREHLNKLKAKSTETEKEIKYTSFEVFTGHLWRCACKARELANDQETRFYFAVNGRPRLKNPPLPAGYFGNVNFKTVAFALAGDLVSKPLSYAASCIHDAIVRIDDEYIRSTIDYLELEIREKMADLSNYGHGIGVGSPNLGITSWFQMPIYDTDFGWGKPIFMCRAAIPKEGKAYMIPNPPGDDGTFSLFINLESKSMELFSNLVNDF